LLRVQQVLTPSVGAAVLDRLWAQAAPDRCALDDVVIEAKRLVVDDVQAAEVDRLMRLVRRILPDLDQSSARRSLEALLVAMDRYRAYVVPGRAADPEQAAVIEAAAGRARAHLAPTDEPALEVIVDLVLDRELRDAALDTGPLADDFRVRFQQTCGPVMAKGIEDTAYYRWFRLAGANEVGGHPDHLSISAEEFHTWCEGLVASWPTSMTTLTTHDTKRSEDVRARLMSLAEDGEGWATWVAAARTLGDAHRPALVDSPTEYLLWQTLVGAWPITGSRLEGYLLKAVREAKVHTAWVDGDTDYEDAVTSYARDLTHDPLVQSHLDAWTVAHEPSVRANVLAQKLIQLTMPGVPDVYQGCETVTLSLVDPDNRRPVHWTDRGERLARLVAGEPALDLDDEKMRVSARALRVRREDASAFVGEGTTYTGWPARAPMPWPSRGETPTGCVSSRSRPWRPGCSRRVAGSGMPSSSFRPDRGATCWLTATTSSPGGRCRWRRCWSLARWPCWCGTRERGEPTGCGHAADRGLGPEGRARRDRVVRTGIDQ
jgi:(1->4)-alpha-D-glucan 1-alpha-D-glucosylmutase